jgi:Glycosyl hydrolases family 16
MQFSLRRALPLLALAGSALAQTFTDCDPTKTTCPADTALGIANYSINFQNNMMSKSVWNATAGTVNYDDDGATFTIAQRGDAPTVKTRFYIFFGQVEVIMKAGKGQGVVSSIVMQSDDLDEVDWEWIGGNSTHVQTNYFGKGNTTSFDRAIWYTVDNPQDNWHNYTTNWTPDRLEWYIDGQLIRTLEYADANGGHNFPQTPCDVRLGIWAGGDPKNPNGTIEWAGGEINYDDTPYTMTVKSVRVTDSSRGTQYLYGDKTGSYQSIKTLNTTDPIKLDGDNSASASQTAKQKWNGLSKTTKIIIAASVLGVVVVCIAVFAFCCIRQRRAGKHEKLVEDAKFEKNQSELLAYRAQMSRMRSEKLAEARAMGVPAANMHMMGPGAGASFVAQSPNPALDPRNHYMNGGYARSVSSFGSAGQQGSMGGRGYQRY